MIIENLFHTSLFKGAQILAGKTGLTSDVSWCVPEEELHPGKEYVPGFMILSVCSVPEFLQEEHLRQLFAYRPSAILLFGGVLDCKLSIRQRGIFDEQGIALIGMPGNVNVLAFSRRFLAFTAENYLEDYRKENFLKELCCSGNYPGSELPASIYGYNRRMIYYCMIVKLCGEEAARLQNVEYELQNIREAVSCEFVCEETPVLAYTDGLILVSILPCSASESMCSVHTRIRQSVRRIRQNYHNYNWGFYVGSQIHKISDFRESYESACRTIEIVAALRVEEEVSFYDDWYMQTLLLRAPREELRTYVEYRLGPILSAGELMEALDAYLSHAQNLKAAADALFIHVNTLKYRLQRIERLLDCDFKSPHSYFQLQMSLFAWKYLSASD